MAHSPPSHSQRLENTKAVPYRQLLNEKTVCQKPKRVCAMICFLSSIVVALPARKGEKSLEPGQGSLGRKGMPTYLNDHVFRSPGFGVLQDQNVFRFNVAMHHVDTVQATDRLYQLQSYIPDFVLAQSLALVQHAKQVTHRGQLCRQVAAPGRCRRTRIDKPVQTNSQFIAAVSIVI